MGCVEGDGFDVCVGEGFGVDVCVGEGFEADVCVGGELSLESLMEGFSVAITTDCFSTEAFSFGRKEFEFPFMRC